MSRPQRRRSPPAGATLPPPPRVCTFVPKRFTRRFQTLVMAGGKPGKACRLVASGGCAGLRSGKGNPHSSAAARHHGPRGPKLSGEGLQGRRPQVYATWGERGVCTSSPPPRCSTESFDALVEESNTRLRICRVESLHHRATGMEIIGILAQMSNMGYDFSIHKAVYPAVLSPKPLTLRGWAYRTVIAIVKPPLPRQAL